MFLGLQNLCRIQTGLYLLQLMFCCKSSIDTLWIFSDILIQESYLCQITQKSRTKEITNQIFKGVSNKGEPFACWFGSLLKNALRLPETISKNLRLAGSKGSYFSNIERFYFYHLVADFSSSYKCD